MTGQTTKTRFSTILNYLTPHRKRLLTILALLLSVSAISVVPPLLAGMFTRSLLEPGSGELGPWVIILLWLLVAGVKTGLNIASGYMSGSTGQEITHKLRQRLYQHMQMLPLSYHHNQRRGDVLTILYSDTSRISSFVTESGLQVLPSLLTFVAALAMMLWLNPMMGGLALLFLPAYVLAMKIVGRRLRPLSRRWVDADSESYSVMEENLGMLPTIKAFTREGLEKQRFRRSLERLLAVSREQLWIEALYSPAIGLVGTVAVVAALTVGYLQIQAGQLQAPELVSLMFYALLMMTPLQSLANLYGALQTTRGAAVRIINFLNELPEPEDKGKRALTTVSGAVDFCNVGYSYPGGPPVLQGLNLSIAARETVAITGPNGAGKSTLAYLLMRFGDPDTGVIRIDGTDTQAVTIESIRGQIGLVAQHVLLLNGSVGENIAYGQPGATEEEIKAAAKAARAHDFICAMPEGYNTVIGDQGVKLSGGQRQRVSLARALLKDPPILILDEATAMFDPEGEQEFIRECQQALKQKTVIIITHRPASLALADRVINFAMAQIESIVKPDRV